MPRNKTVCSLNWQFSKPGRVLFDLSTQQKERKKRNFWKWIPRICHLKFREVKLDTKDTNSFREILKVSTIGFRQWKLIRHFVRSLTRDTISARENQRFYHLFGCGKPRRRNFVQKGRKIWLKLAAISLVKIDSQSFMGAAISSGRLYFSSLRFCQEKYVIL